MEGLKFDFVDGKVVLAAEYKEPSGLGVVALTGEVDLIAILTLAAAKTDNKIDDAIVEMVEKALA